MLGGSGIMIHMRQEELVGAIADSPFFKAMVPDVREALAGHGRVVVHGNGEVIFRPKQPAPALYLILEGVVEISREVEEGEGLKPVAYIGPGAVLGESKVITGTALKSQARFPEGGRTIQWSRPLILRMVYESRDFSLQEHRAPSRRDLRESRLPRQQQPRWDARSLRSADDSADGGGVGIQWSGGDQG